jgi:hypothetical protein
VIVSSPSPRAIVTANEQLNQIEDATAERMWDSTNWLQQTKNEIGKESVLPLECSRVPLQPFRGTIHYFGASGSIEKSVEFQFTDQNWILDTRNLKTVWRYDANARSLTWHLVLPKTLADFTQLWDARFSVFCPTVAGSSFMQEYGGSPGPNIVTEMPMKRDPHGTTRSIGSANLHLLPANHPFLDGIISTDFGYSSRLEFVDGFNISSQTTIAVPVRKGINVLVGASIRQELIKVHPSNHWRDSAFSDSFYELDQATAGFQDLDFYHLKKILRVQQTNSKEVFTAFGVTFPSETTTRWGMLIILAIQLYFWLHLAEYRR